MHKDEVKELKVEVVNKWQRGPASAVLHESMKSSGAQSITFSNSQASEFEVNGGTFPVVYFDVGLSWVGLLPVKNSPDETRQFFPVQYV
ncbi:hypothetical protein PAXRUDRAFT_19331 [Paxillus rubicundulus Ve08.2h10]|uniref:Uncharacterized protein n=1 Tax=Paxillus rubicundulus Ve08.2h10 TaxID=930991 RepID=A0A0D0CIN6_9AGAM|nr:hypothetical protein PAXRUDRAFT_19331 [Paxillus rubicundulus Ve08.2h10]